MARGQVYWSLCAAAVLVAAAGCGGGGGGGSDEGALYPGAEFATGEAPQGLAVVDIDGDGRMDVLTADAIGNSVSVLAGNGDGTLQDAVPYPGGVGPTNVAVADVNADGINDIVTNQRPGAELLTLLGNSDGTFQAPLVTNTSVLPWGDIVVTMLDGDEYPDLVVNTYPPPSLNNAVSVFLNDGDGTFTQTAQTFPIGADPGGPPHAAVADLNGDEQADIALPDFAANAVHLYFGSGDGSFQAPMSVPLDDHQFSCVAADVDNDGALDLVAAEFDEEVFVLMGDGTGSFEVLPKFVVSEDFSISNLRVAFLNDDNYPDLVMHNDKIVGTMLGRGDGRFEPLQQHLAGESIRDIATADVNKDRDIDVVLTNAEDDVVAVLLGNGDGTLDARRYTEVGDELRFVKLADIDGDGVGDLLGGTPFVNEVLVFIGDGRGTFTRSDSIPVADDPTSMLVQDLNDDDLFDFLVELDSGGIAVYLGQDTGNFTAGQTFDSDSVGHEGVESLASLADLDGDTVPDLVLLQSDGLEVWLGVGDGTFAGPAEYFGDTLDGDLRAADFDRDGAIDILSGGGEGLLLFPGRGDGTLQSPISIPLEGAAPWCTAVGDVNRDGFPDVVFIVDDAATVLLNLGGGAFAAPVEYAIQSLGNTVTLADLDNNNRLDIVVEHSNTDKLSILLGNGDGTFQEFTTIRLSQGESLEIGDLNSDGRPDFVAGHSDSELEGIVALLHR